MPRIREHLSADAVSFLKGELARSMEVAAAVEGSITGVGQSVSGLAVHLAYQTTRSIFDFTKGIGDGVYQGFYDTAHVVHEICFNPRFVREVGDSLLRTLSKPDVLVTCARDAFTQFYLQLAYGSPREKGQLLGDLTFNVLVSLATAEICTCAEIRD